ncbi:hypothetical protein LOY38_14615 [Pseudomonas sp. B21-015]|uniref:hypothetical protein n=1 Tax=Pseudomonas sp. B21-015 TaxID=2895473 RepID=UPI00215E1532|nr:hypothetical protein [Pseudomonas sp. B21-015]UVM53159.1 hypothetical protein LOY38_14615 [Pseudomonas sp. B21-015]
MIAAFNSTALHRRKDPPKRSVYLSLVAASPCMALAALWNQGDLTVVSASITLSVAAYLYLRLETIQNCFRPAWAKEYEWKLAKLMAQLSCEGLSAVERQKLLNRIDDLKDRYHLVTSSQVTYRWIKRQAYAMLFIARILRLNIR